jgi:hypothetical protein
MRSVTDLEALSTGELVGLAADALHVLAARPAPESSGLCFELAGRLGIALDRGEAALATLVGAADRAGEAKAHRYASTQAWLRIECQMRTGRAVERTVLARQLTRLPQVAERFRSEKLSFGLASTITEAVTHLSDADCLKAEEILLELVDRGCSATQVAKTAARIKDVISERDGTDRAPEDGARDDRSWWRVSRSLKGGGFTKGWFSPTLLALVTERLGPLAQPAGPDDDRDHAQRLADALETVLSGGATNWNATVVIKLDRRPAGTPQTHDQGTRAPGRDIHDQDGRTTQTEPERPGGRTSQEEPEKSCVDPSSVRVPTSGQTPADSQDPLPAEEPERPGGRTSQEEPGRPCAGPPPMRVPTSGQTPADSQNPLPAEEPQEGTPRDPAPVPAWPLEQATVSSRLADGTPIPSWQARLIALNAGISALVLGPDGIPLYRGRKVRFVTSEQRRVLEALYDTCAFQECEIPTRLCQVDHVTSWDQGGVTDIDLLAPCCAFHNRLKYAKPGWITAGRDEGGRWCFTVKRTRLHRPTGSWPGGP